jgi:hypothetical protein
MEPLISQRSLILGSKVGIALKDRDWVVVTTSGRFWKNERTYPLDEVSPEPARARRIDHQWCFASVVLALLASLFFLVATDEGQDTTPLVVIGLFFAVPAAYAIVRTIALSREVLVYTQVQTHAPLFVLCAGRPSRAEVERFIARFAEAIRDIRYPRDLSPTDRLEHYGRHVHFLHREGVISAVELAMILGRLERRAREAEAEAVAVAGAGGPQPVGISLAN